MGFCGVDGPSLVLARGRSPVYLEYRSQSIRVQIETAAKITANQKTTVSKIDFLLMPNHCFLESTKGMLDKVESASVVAVNSHNIGHKRKIERVPSP